MKALVMGATGFIGRKLVDKLLSEDWDVSAITRESKIDNYYDKKIKFVILDLVKSTASAIDLSKYDVIFNCAGEVNDESKMHDLHVNSVRKLLPQLKGSNTKWVQLSSVGVYGEKDCGEVIESDPFNPKGEYEITKAEAEVLVRKYCTENEISFSILRPANVFGLNMPNNSLRSFVKIIKSGFFFYIGEPKNYRVCYVHIDNVVESLFLIAVSENANGEAFIISDSMLLIDFVDLICEAFYVKKPNIKINYSFTFMIVNLFSKWSKFPLSKSRALAMTSDIYYSNKKISHRLGFVPVKSVKEGMLEFIFEDFNSKS